MSETILDIIDNQQREEIEQMRIQEDEKIISTLTREITMKELWVCGQLRELTEYRGRSIWDLVGVFDTEAMAKAACRDKNYFIYPIERNKQYPEEEVYSTGGYYPTVEQSRGKRGIKAWEERYE